MKQYTTRILKTVALLYMAFPVLYLPVSAVLFDVSMPSCVSVLLSFKYCLFSIMAITVGYGFWEMKRWAWYVFVPFNVLIVYENGLLAFSIGESLHPVLAFLFSMAGILALTWRVAREVRVPYFFPRINWWETDPRYRISVPVSMKRQDGSVFSADILDLSLGGCFVKLRAELQQDEIVRLGFGLFGFLIECEGVIVWRTRSTVTTPKGVGIKFHNVDRTQKRALRMINRRLKKIASLYRRSRHLLNEEEVLKRLHKIEAGTRTRTDHPTKVG